MKKLLLFAVVAWFAWHTWGRGDAEAPEVVAAVPAPAAAGTAPEWRPEPRPSQQFSCDGRTHCSQMRSCEEATYFVRHCPNTRMDGDGDGIPCKRQWCG